MTVFLGCQVAMLCNPGEHAARALIAAGAAATFGLFEVIARRLRPHHRTVLYMLGICTGEVAFDWAAVASAGV